MRNPIIAFMLCAAAALGAEPITFGVVAAERYDADFDVHRVHVLAKGGVGHWAIAPGSPHLVYVESEKLFSIGLDGTKRTSLLDDLPAGSFRLTPDGKYVVMRGGAGSAVTRVLVTGGSRVAIAKKMQMHVHGSLVVSPDSSSIAFTTAEGPLAIADVLEGTAQLLDIPPPSTQQCHFGAGSVRSFTPDSKRLVYQHGCYEREIIGRDGSGRAALSKDAMELAGEVALGYSSFTGFDVVPLSGGEPWRIETTKLDGLSGPTVAPSGKAIAFLGADRGVYFARLDSKKVVRVSPEGLEGMGFFSFTPDGSALLWPGRKGRRCEAHRWDIASGRDSLLVALESTQQCFVKAAGNKQAVVNAYHGQMSVFAVDLKSLVVRRLAAPFPTAGNVGVSNDGRWVVVESRGGPTASVWSIEL